MISILARTGSERHCLKLSADHGTVAVSIIACCVRLALSDVKPYILSEVHT